MVCLWEGRCQIGLDFGNLQEMKYLWIFVFGYLMALIGNLSKHCLLLNILILICMLELLI